MHRYRTLPSGDGLAVAFDPATDHAGKKVKVVVTVTGTADDKINIGVKCGDDDTLAAKDYEVTDSKATSDEFDAPAAGAAAITCTATASGKVGGVDKTDTKSFEIEAADDGGGGSGPSLTLAIHDDDSGSMGDARAADAAAVTEATSVHAKVVVTGKKEDGSDVAVADLVVTWNCTTDADTATKVFSTDNAVTMGAVSGEDGAFSGSIMLDDDSTNNEITAAAHTCTISASINGVSGSEQTATVGVTGAAS